MRVCVCVCVCVSVQVLESGALPVFLRMLQHDDPKEHASTAACLWTLSFDKAVRTRIKEHEGLLAALETVAKSDNHAVRKSAMGALWVIKGENDPGTSSSKGPRPSSILCERVEWRGVGQRKKEGKQRGGRRVID